MPILYDIDKQLIDIAREFEKKFTKQGQEAPAAQQPIGPPKQEPIQDVMERNLTPSKKEVASINSVAIKFLDNLEKEVASVNTSDLKDLTSFVTYCLDKKTKSSAGDRLVYNSGTNNIGAASLDFDFRQLKDTKQNEYVEYKAANAMYYVHREGMIEFLNSMQLRAKNENNKVGEVMLGKVIDEANAKLQLGVDKNNPKAPAPKVDADGRANQQGKGSTPSLNVAIPQSVVDHAQDQLEKATFDRLAKKGPLFGDELDLENIRLFAQLVKDATSQPYFTTWLMFRYGYPPDAPTTRSNIDNQKSMVIRSCDTIINNVNKFCREYLRSPVIPAANVAVGSSEGFVQNFNTLMLDGRKTAAYVAEVLNFCRETVDQLPYLLGTVTQKADYLASQKSIAATWKQNLGRAYQSANIARNQDASKLAK